MDLINALPLLFVILLGILFVGFCGMVGFLYFANAALILCHLPKHAIEHLRGEKCYYKMLEEKSAKMHSSGFRGP